MSKRSFLVALVLGLASVAAWAGNQPPVAEVKKPMNDPARYSVAPAGNSAVLLDGVSGRTWMLQPTGEGAAWVPVRRFDTEKEVRTWQEAERARKLLPRPGTSPGPLPLPKLPPQEGLQYDAARIRAALDAVDLRVKDLQTREAEVRSEREKLYRDLERVEKQLKNDQGGPRLLPK